MLRVYSMRFLGILCLVFTLLAFGAAEQAAYAASVSAHDTIAANLAQPPAHAGHVATHQALPDGDMSSMLCKILCALAVSQSPLAVPNSFDNWLQIRGTVVAAGNVEADEVAPGPHLPPPR